MPHLQQLLRRHLPRSTWVNNARVYVTSMRSPTDTPLRFFLSSTLRVMVRPSDVVTVIDGRAGSIALTVTVIFSRTAAVAPGSDPLPLVIAASRVASAGFAPVVPAVPALR